MRIPNWFIPALILTLMLVAPLPCPAQQEPLPPAEVEASPTLAQPGPDPIQDKDSDPQPALDPVTLSAIPPAALEKLSQERIYNLAYKQLDLEEERLEKATIDLVGIFAPLGTFTMIVLIIWLVVAHRSRKDRQIHETLRLMVEKGAEIPADLLTRKPPQNIDLRRGILLLSLGIGYMTFMALLGVWEPEAWTGLGVGLIPIFVGIGYLLVWRINKKV